MSVVVVLSIHYIKVGNTITVKLREYRRPQVGDKFASRHAQKGTIGQIMNEEDLPTTKDGIRPDIIINPLSIPSRMTIGMLMEMFLGTQSALYGQFNNGTVHKPFSWDDVKRAMVEHGYERQTGKQDMYDGATGRKLRAEVFIGPCYLLCTSPSCPGETSSESHR